MLEEQAPADKPKFSIITALVTVVVIAAIALSLWTVLKPVERQPAPAVEINVPAAMTPQEQAYAASIRFENIALSRAENFIHQEVTILNADAVNDGARALDKLIVVVEFSDGMNQVVLRESRSVLGNTPASLSPGQRRSFELSFDGVPPSWNMQQPVVRVGYLRFATLK
jgi:hypothetical protein